MEEQKSSAEEIKFFVRIANTDLDGKKPIAHALTKIKGISFMFSNMLCRLANIDNSKITGLLSDEEVKKIDEAVRDPLGAGAPAWMFNRQRDPSDGTSRHLITAILAFTHDNDIKLMKKMRSYKGIRHALGLPVRGQRTRSNFRKNKGNVLGVRKKSVSRKT